MFQLQSGRFYHPAVFMHRTRGISVELLAIDFTTGGSVDSAQVTLRRPLIDKVFVFEDDDHVHGPEGEAITDAIGEAIEFRGDDWRVRLPADYVCLIPILAGTTPPKCFRCAFTEYVQKEINGSDYAITIASLNFVKKPAQDMFGRMGLNRVLLEPLQAVSFTQHSIGCVSAFRLGYSESAAPTETLGVSLMYDATEKSGVVLELPLARFAKLVAGSARGRLFGHQASDLSRAVHAFGEPDHEFSLVVSGEHAIQLLRD